MRNPRLLIAAGVALAALAVVVVVLSLAGGESANDDGDRPLRVVRATLTLERVRAFGSMPPELLVSLPSERLNTPEATGGARVVTLRCLDAGGAVTLSGPADWPLLTEPGFPPHIHQPVKARLLDRISVCSLTGPGIDFEGRVTPAAG